MADFYHALELMEAQFGRDYQFVLATAQNDVPFARFIDALWTEGSFYFVTSVVSHKARQLKNNPNARLLGRQAHTFSGKAYSIGHPLERENAEIREKLIEAFRPWYFLHNNEADANMRYFRFYPAEGFFHRDGTGYRIREPLIKRPNCQLSCRKNSFSKIEPPFFL